MAALRHHLDEPATTSRFRRGVLSMAMGKSSLMATCRSPLSGHLRACWRIDQGSLAQLPLRMKKIMGVSGVSCRVQKRASGQMEITTNPTPQKPSDDCLPCL